MVAQFQDVDDNWHCRYHHYIYNCRFNCLCITILYHIHCISIITTTILHLYLYCTSKSLFWFFNSSKIQVNLSFRLFSGILEVLEVPNLMASSKLKAQFHFYVAYLHTLIYLYFYLSSTCPSPVSIYIAIFARILILTVCLTPSSIFNKSMSKILKYRFFSSTMFSSKALRSVYDATRPNLAINKSTKVIYVKICFL